MRLDDDSFIEEPVPDLFEWMNDNKYIYTSNILNIDCGICCYGMKDFFEKHFSNKKEIIDKLFIEKDIPSKTFQLFKFRSLLSIMNNTMKIEENLKLPMPIMFYNNFFITKTSFWERTDVKALVDKVDKDGSIFYYRWGDAPLQTIIVKLLAKDTEVKQSIFKYSKRLQRESFTDPSGDFHSYLPELYSQSSCITEMNPIP
jgi:hypothetical protein